MKKYTFFITTLAVIMAVITFSLNKRVASLSEAGKIHLRNERALLNENRRYKTKDSLNAISVRELNLRLSELRRYRAADAKLITSLNADIKRLRGLTNITSETIRNIERMPVSDTILIVGNTVADTIRRFSYHDEWLDLSVCIDSTGGHARITSRDSIVYVEHVVPKRFLFFKWGEKERRQEIVSLNPHTRIVDAKFITVRHKRK